MSTCFFPDAELVPLADEIALCRQYMDIEKLRLGEREVDALLLRGDWKDRRIDFWLAPEWHNIPVRMTIALGREDLTLDIWANEIVLDGRRVLEWVKPQQKERTRNR